MLYIHVLHSAALLVIATRCAHRTQVGRGVVEFFFVEKIKITARPLLPRAHRVS